MKYIISKVLEAIVVVASIMLMGIFIPLFMSIAIATLTDDTFSSCTNGDAFWVFTGVCSIISAVYMSYTLDRKNRVI